MKSQEESTKSKKTVTKEMCFVGGCIHEGQPICGTEMTPDLMRDSHLFQVLHKKYDVNVYDYGNVSIGDLSEEERNAPQIHHTLRNLSILDPMLHKLHLKCFKAAKQHPQGIVVTVGGDHSVGTSTISALRKLHPTLKLIWVDAHPDLLDSSSDPYPGYHGTPCSHLTGINKIPGFKWLQTDFPLQSVAYIGIRDIDKNQWNSLRKHGILSYTPDHIDKLGIGQVVSRVLHKLDPSGDAPFHITFDIDAIDPLQVPATGTRYRYGLSGREAVHIVRRTAQERKLVGLDVVEINQKIKGHHGLRAKFRGEEDYGDMSASLGLGVDLIQSLFTEYLTL